MLREVSAFFEQRIGEDGSGTKEEKLRLATAALLIEMAKQDDRIEEVEVRKINQALITQFNLTVEECEELFAMAEKELSESVDYYQFTKLIAKQFTQKEKIKVIELLWSVAYADSKLEALEEHMVRKIADLIYVPHKDFIRVKHKVKG